MLALLHEERVVHHLDVEPQQRILEAAVARIVRGMGLSHVVAARADELREALPHEAALARVRLPELADEELARDASRSLRVEGGQDLAHERLVGGEAQLHQQVVVPADQLFLVPLGELPERARRLPGEPRQFRVHLRETVEFLRSDARRVATMDAERGDGERGDGLREHAPLDRVAQFVGTRVVRFGVDLGGLRRGALVHGVPVGLVAVVTVALRVEFGHDAPRDGGGILSFFGHV